MLETIENALRADQARISRHNSGAAGGAPTSTPCRPRKPGSNTTDRGNGVVTRLVAVSRMSGTAGEVARPTAPAGRA